MSDKNFKTIRKQLRAVVSEALPELLKKQFYEEIHKDVAAQVQARLETIAKQVSDSLAQIDARSKDVQAYVLRNSAPVVAPETTETPEIAPLTPGN